MKASHKLAEQIYAKPGGAGAEAKGPEAEKAKKPEDVVDAEFEEVK